MLSATRAFTVGRRELEKTCRVSLEEAHGDYTTATQRYRNLRGEQTGVLPPNWAGALALARHAESLALAEYTRVLRIFIELTITGEFPEERPASSARV